MYRKIRIVVVSLVVAMICVVGSSMTLAYFTDTDSTTNNFVIGNASTKLMIYDDVSGSAYHELNVADYSPLVGIEENGTVRDIKFYLQAQNDGNIPVYQRFRIAIPKNLAGLVTVSLGDGGSCDAVVATSCNYDGYTASYKSSVHNNEYAEYYITRTIALDVNAKTSEWPTTNLRITGISEANKSSFECSGDNNNCVLGIKVYSDAIQTAGFANAAQAFENFAETYN